jgi:HK97 family phage prohead protease
MEKERRYVKVSELRATNDGERPIIEGHAAVFNQPSLEIFGVPGWREVIRPGAFSKVIKTDDVRALINHNDDRLIGRVSNNTLQLEEDEIGLRARIFPPDTSDTRDLLVLIRGRYLSQMSFGFRVSEDGEQIDRNNKLREITEFRELFDVSPVTQPAYPQTDVHLRSRFEQLQASIVALNPDEEKVKDELLRKARAEFIASRTPPPDPNSFDEIIKNARITAGS